MLRTTRSLISKLESRAYATLPTTNSPIVSKLKFFNTVTGDATHIPTFRVMDGLGKLLEGAEEPEMDKAFAQKIYTKMQLLPTLDNLLYNVQRQGKISFYMTAHGEEATIIGSAAALADDDEVLGQYREMGVLLWRGFGLDSVMNQCMGNVGDKCTLGRQMPIHFGSPEHHFHTISSPLATQLPQAAGVAYALRHNPARAHNIAAAYFGDGAASEGDFHAGLLLASTLPAPAMFIARNNGFAISTPASEQFYGDGIASRGPGYGVHTIRVDGNDVLAVLAACRAARKICVESGRAVLVESMTYRVGHHSTSDDSYAYRARSEVDDRKRIDNPIARYRLFLESRGWWSAAEEEELKATQKATVMKAYKLAETLERPPLMSMFNDVYDEQPWNIVEQRQELGGLLKKYGSDWEPWRTELAKFQHQGKDVMDGKI